MDISIKRDGLCLRGRLDRPDGIEKSPAAILFHGYAGDLGYEKDSFYQKMTDFLTEAGIAVVRFDFNGHGKSEGDFARMNVLNEIEDAIAILEFVKKLDFVTNIYIIGHSQGGVVAGMLAGYYADIIQKLVLLAPAATLKSDAQKGVCMGSVYDTMHIPDHVRVGEHLVGGHYFRIAKLLPIYEVTRQFQGPALVIHGIFDDVVDASVGGQYKKCMENCELILLKEIDHGIQGKEQIQVLNAVRDFLLQ